MNKIKCYKAVNKSITAIYILAGIMLLLTAIMFSSCSNTQEKKTTKRNSPIVNCQIIVGDTFEDTLSFDKVKLYKAVNEIPAKRDFQFQTDSVDIYCIYHNQQFCDKYYEVTNETAGLCITTSRIDDVRKWIEKQIATH